MQVIADGIQKQMAGASWIRKMFEKGMELKKQFGADHMPEIFGKQVGCAETFSG